MELKDIIRQHSNSVAAVFKARGVKVPVNAQNLMLQVFLGKNSFIDQLADQIEHDASYSNYDGGIMPMLPKETMDIIKSGKPPFNVPKTLPAVTVPAKAKAQKAKATLNEILHTVADTFGTFLGAKKAAQAAGTAAAAGGGNASQPTKPDEDKKQTNFLIIAVVVLIIAMIIAVVAKNNG